VTAFSASKGGVVFEHSLLRRSHKIREAFHGRALQCFRRACHNQGRKRSAFHVLRNDKQGFSLDLAFCSSRGSRSFMERIFVS